MTTVLISGATGLVGRFIAERFIARGDDTIVMGRSCPPAGFFSEPVEWVAGNLDPDHDFSPAFDGVDVFIHCAFHHVPGRYRGGEGNDPDGFRRANVDGTLALMEAAKRSGAARAVFLSSRAVYGQHSPGTVLTEDTPCAPDTLYGQAKLAVEHALSAMASETFWPIILRATGVYGPAGPGQAHKWASLFADYKAGKQIAQRIGTEVHGDDLARAADLLIHVDAADLTAFGPAPVVNVSDILLDRHDLLAAYAELTGIHHRLPARAKARAFNAMDCARLKSLGWAPRGTLDLTSLT